MSADATPAAPRKKKGKLLVLAICLVFGGAGAAAPLLIPKTHADQGEENKKPSAKTVSVPFGDAVVNLAEAQMTRYLKLKIAILTDADHEKEMTEKLTAQKAEVKSRIIAHIAGKSLKDVSGKVGVNRLQRELHDLFDDVLYPDGHGHIRNILFEEYVVQ